MTATVEIFGLTGEEMAKVGQDAVQKARAKRFEQGLPVVLVRDGVVVREYPDGTLETLTDVPQVAE